MSILYQKHSRFSKSILIRNFKGEVDVNEIIRSWEYLRNESLLTHQLKGVINNLTECDLVMDLNSFKLLMSYLNQHECFYSIKLAVVCDKPKSTVYPTLGAEKESKLKIKPFSTVDAAVQWIIV
ncbi:hypothetical protein [Carboxylicivirga caseinilyticus]|uniref:hypothetical protein n=1 Tax=Carboxylicivirga caseinilyticus TaxID=3417572 RepID=UPI003D33EE1A|nr:hypothetical protein [Marinilabiliaceae bacterium A049]